MQKLYKYLLAAVLVIVPLFPKFPLFSVPGTYVSVRFEDFLLLLLGVITFWVGIKNFKTLLQDKVIIAFVIFFGVNLVSVISGVYLTKTIDLHLGLLNYFRRLEYLIPFFSVLVLFNCKQISENLDYFMKTLLIVVFVAFIYGLGQRYLSFPIIITQNDTYSKGVALRWTVGSHISSTFAGHYDLAAFMVMMMPIFITLFFVLKDKWDRLATLIVSASGIWLLINSLSRISQVSYLVAVSIPLLILKKFKALAVVFVVSILVIGLSSSLEARFSRVFDVYFQKIKSDFVIHAETKIAKTPSPTPVPVFEDRSTSIRVNVEWPTAMRAFVKNPLLGTGYSSIGLATDNDYLRMLAETGLLGFVSFVLIFVKIGEVFLSARKILNKFRPLEFGFVAGTFGAMTGIFISVFFIDLFEASKFATIYWFMVACSISLIRNKLNEQKA